MNLSSIEKPASIEKIMAYLDIVCKYYISNELKTVNTSNNKYESILLAPSKNLKAVRKYIKLPIWLRILIHY